MSPRSITNIGKKMDLKARAEHYFNRLDRRVASWAFKHIKKIPWVQRRIQAEFVWRRKLTGVKAGRATVTEIGEVTQVLCGELSTRFHGREDGAETLAVTARVAYHHDSPRLRHGGCLGVRYSIETHAASSPAIRPNTDPIAMPVPAQ